MDQELDLLELSGTIDSVIYKNEENGYTVLRLKDGNDAIVTVVGCFPYAASGETIIVSGTWMTHSTHGRQFKAEFAQRMLPSSAQAIYTFLAGGCVKGIGPATASLIVNRFGEKSLDVLENSPELLVDIKGISLSKAKQMSASFSQQAGVRRLMEFVCSFGLRPILAMRMYRFYGDEALKLLQDNPYVLAAAHVGGSFAEADKMALEMGVDSYSKNRIEAAVIFELIHNSGNGHCFIPREKLAAATAALIGAEPEDIEESIDKLQADGRLVFEHIAKCDACYLPALYDAETTVAQHIGRMAQRSFNDRTDIEKLVAELERSQAISYAPMQKKTLELALENQVLVITGGPGTGKTTTVRALLAMFDRLHLRTLLTAPTGRAAKRMSELSGQEAQTVHRLLEAKFSEDGEHVVFGKDEGNLLDCDAVILDECSMVDVELMAALLRAMPTDARLVMVGDADQLPSVGPGNVFSAVIRSEVVATVRLTEIFRQTGDSRIVRNAHMINRGEHPNLSENAGDFFRLHRLEAGSSVETISELFAVRLPGKMNIPPEEIQVLSPTRKGEMGTVNLNRVLQKALNPAAKTKREKLFGETIFREGDRVMQIKNNYDLIWRHCSTGAVGSGVFNGDIGIIASVDLDAELLTVDYDGRQAAYSFDLLPELEHAWAMTVHKSQGSEYRAVILSLSASSPMLMTRDVFYTAVTRAKQLLILVGDEKAAHQMIDNYKRSNRYTALRVRLRDICEVS